MRRAAVPFLLAFVLLLGVAGRLAAQELPVVPLVVEVRAEGQAVEGASVRAGAATGRTDASGLATLRVAVGPVEVTVEAATFLPGTASVDVREDGSSRVTVELTPLEEDVLVSATRSGTRLEDQPLRVEVIDREEIEEKALMTPGSVTMLLGETTGLRVQVTSPSLGGSNVRIQGLRGHYSQLLADGLPLYGAQGDSFSMLQVPPLDLGQVEVIKGVASALYGMSALGGVVNLVSRRPRAAENEILLNATTLDGTDATLWMARPGRWSWSTIAGYHGQKRTDVDGDGWTDVAGYDRGMIRPRVTFDDERGSSLLFTAGLTAENREGGTLPGFKAPDGRAFRQTLDTRHVDAAAVGRWLKGSTLFAARGSIVRNRTERGFGEAFERGDRATLFAEASATGNRGRHTWVAGVAFQRDRYDDRDAARLDFAFRTPSVFAQDELRVTDRLTLAASARLDAHSEYGTLVSPRLSLLARPDDRWILRASAGEGAYAPTPFNEETEETGLSRLAPLRGLRSERARGGVLDVTFHHGPVELSGTAFASRVRFPVFLKARGPASVALENANEPTRTHGTEFIARWRREGFLVMATHAWTVSSELDVDSGRRREVALTPRHYGSLNVMWEREETGGVGLEAYWFGRQPLEDDPSLATSRSYVLLGGLARRRFGRVLAYVNVENLLDVRQQSEESMVLPRRRADGRWLVDAWAPLDGRVWNAGLRLFF